MIRCILLFLLAIAALGAETREVSVYAAPPLHVAVPVAQRSQLLVGKATLTLEPHEVQLLDLVGNWTQGRVAPVFRRNVGGFEVDEQGVQTPDQTRWVVDGYRLTWFAVSLFDSDTATWTTHVVADDSAADDQSQAFVANTTLVVGEVYWYSGSTTSVIDVKHGTRFATTDDVQLFAQRDLHQATTSTYRARGVMVGSSVLVGDRWNLPVSGATRSMTTSSVRGALFGVVTSGRQGYVWYENDVLVDGQASTDPYFLDGHCLIKPNGVVLPGGAQWSFARESDSRYVALGSPSSTRPDSILPEPQRTEYLRYLGLQRQEIVLITQPQAVTTVGGQDTNNLIIGIQAGQVGTAQDAVNYTEAKAAAGSSEAFSTDGTGNLVPVQGSAFADPALEDIRAETVNGLGNGIAIRMQQSQNEVVQVKPETVVPREQDAMALQDAIFAVESELYPQTATSLPLRGRAPGRFAEMHPAGWLDRYLQGSPLPGDGDNPVSPHPSGIVTGAPAYDLDGDGDLDRFLTSDPYDNGFDELILKWNVEARKFSFGEYNQNNWKNHFAVYAQTKTKPDTRKLLFVGHDAVIYVEKKDRWSGKNFHSFSLNHILHPIGEPNLYRLGLKFIGTPQANMNPEGTIIPRSETVSWSTTEQRMVGNQMVTVILSTGTETAYLYDEMADPDLVSESFSDLSFVPRATAGKPLMPARYVRQVTPYTFVGGMSVPGTPVTTVIYFPADFRESALIPEQPMVVPSGDLSWRWDYPVLGDGMPYNYKRGPKFPRGYTEVALNDTRVVSRYGAEMPLQPLSSLLQQGGIDFKLREKADADLALLPVEPSNPDDPNIPINNQRTTDWLAWRADNHSPVDVRTDRSAPGMNTAGERHFTIEEGAGFYMYRGQRVPFSSVSEQRALLERMWSFDMEQPKTVYALLHIDNDQTKPLLNTARAPTELNAAALLHPMSGALNSDLRPTGGNLNANAQRRNELKETIWFFFSAARGREHEVEMAKYVPKNTKLICVEWDDYNLVQRTFAGYDITFVTTNEAERKIKGDVITKVYGKVNIEGRMNAGGSTFGNVVGNAAVVDLAMANPGAYVFLDQDMLYDKPANALFNVALLDDRQYGNPSNAQWISGHKMQFRHPMAIWYDDRWSAVLAAYGLNADPREWTAKWDDYAAPVSVIGADECRVTFESWASERRLADLYDGINETEYIAAKAGDVTLTARPAVVGNPILPSEPAAWSGGSLEPPAVVDAPGVEPTAPTPPWVGLPGYDGLDLEPAIAQYLGTTPAQNGITGLAWTRQRAPSMFAQNPPTVNVGSLAGANAATHLAYVPAAPGGQWHYRTSFTYTGITGNYWFTLAANDDCYFYLNNSLVTEGHWWITSTGVRTLVTGSTYTVLVRFIGAGSPNYFYLSAESAAYRAWLQRKAHTDAYRIVFLAYQADHAEWVNDVERYTLYQEDVANHQTRLNTYEAWRVMHIELLEQYQLDMATYLVNRDRYNAYLAEDALWVTLNADTLSAKERWENYKRDRENWVYLVWARIGESGVDWSDSEPVGVAFAFWKTIDASGSCRN